MHPNPCSASVSILFANLPRKRCALGVRTDYWINYEILSPTSTPFNALRNFHIQFCQSIAIISPRTNK